MRCNDDVGVAIGWGCSGLLEMHLVSLELRDWRHLLRWAAESCSEVVAGSTLFALLRRPAKDMNNSILQMAKGGKANSGMATVLLVMMFVQGVLLTQEAGAADGARDC